MPALSWNCLHPWRDSGGPSTWSCPPVTWVTDGAVRTLARVEAAGSASPKGCRPLPLLQGSGPQASLRISDGDSQLPLVSATSPCTGLCSAF